MPNKRWVCCLCILACVADVRAAETPNIILVMADDLGWGDIRAHGNTIIRMPHLDTMTQAGLRFDRFYAAAPACSPTRGSVMTGRHPLRYGIVDANSGHMKPEEITLAEVLQKRGYRTGHFGKWHLGTLTRTLEESNRGGPRNLEHYAPPQDHGFDVCFSSEAKVPTYDPMFKPAGEERGTWWDPIDDLSKAVDFNTHYWNEQGQIVTDNLNGDDSRVIMDRAIPFIRHSVKQHQPFLAVVWFHAPHRPVVADAQHTEPYSQHDKFMQHYAGSITAMDEQIGRLRATLKELNVEGNTLLAFCSDNGPEGKPTDPPPGPPGSAGVLRGRKRDVYEGGVRVPGCIIWPDVIKPNRTTDSPAVTSDYFPTIMDILDEPPADARPYDGVSLLNLLKGDDKPRPKPIAFRYRNNPALSDNQYKVIRYGKNSNRWELYDLQADPAESRDLAAKFPDVTKRMAQEYQRWFDTVRASAEGKDYPSVKP